MLQRVAGGMGGGILACLAYLGELILILLSGLRHLTTGLGRLPPVCRRMLEQQFQFTAMDAVPITILLAIATASSVVLQLRLLGLQEEELQARILVAVLVRELGPLVAALVVLLRSGTAIAAEMAAMRVTGEVEALRLAGIDPFRYLVVPRLGAVAGALFCLAHLFILAALGSAWMVLAVLGVAPSLGDYLHEIARAFQPSDILLVAAKTVVPGLLIAAIVCREGLSAGRVAGEVPRATTRGAVRGGLAIFIWGAIVTGVGYHL